MVNGDIHASSTPGHLSRETAIRSRFGLKHQLTFGVGTLLIVCIALLTFQSVTALRGQLSRAMQAQDVALLQSLSQHIEAEIAETELDLRDLGRTMPADELADPRLARQWLDRRVGMLRLYDGGLALYGPGGVPVASSKTHLGGTATERTAIKTVLASGRPLISDGFATAAGPRLAIFTPLRMDGHITGVLEGVLKLDGHNAITRVPNVIVGAAGYLFLTDRLGRIIAHPDRDQLLKRLGGGAAVGAGDHAVQGEDMLTNTLPLPATGWHLGLTRGHSHASAMLIREEDYTIAAGLGLLAMIMLAMAYLMRRLTNPLEAIARQIRSVAQSCPSRGQRIRPGACSRELGQLAEDVNGMLETLERQREEIERREKWFRAIIEDCPDTLAVLDAKGRLMFVAPSGHDGGTSTNEMANCSALDYLHPHDRKEARAAIRRALKIPSGIARLDCRMRVPGGAYRHYEIMLHNRLDDPNIAGIVASARDVTKRRAIEAAMRIEEQRLKLALECADLTIFNQDCELRYVWGLNSHLFEAPNAVFGKTDAEIFPAEIATRLIAFKRRAIENGRGERAEFSLVEEGHERTFVLVVEPLREHNGRVIGLLGVSLETTELRRTEEMLYHAKRLESLGRLTGGIAHDFNNYLGIIIANLECVLATLDTDSALRRHGENALSAAQQGTGLTRRLLAFAREKPLQPTTVDLNDLLHEFGGVLRSLAGSSIGSRFDLEPHLWSCRVDPGELQNALVNLVVNALDAMPAGGQLVIRTRNLPECPQCAPCKAGCIALSISDTGRGMPPEVQAHAFEPFFTTKPAGEGTGLGLSMVHGFVRRSGGEVTIDSAPDHGTTVHIYLPPSGQDSSQATTADAGLSDW